MNKVLHGRKLIIGDIHGCSKTFRKLLYDNLQVTTSDQIYLVGDYINKGPDSKAVIDTILELKAKGFEVHCLRGNHEQLMLESDGDLICFLKWKFKGGIPTMESFGISKYSELDEVYKDFFVTTLYYIETDEFILAHAGLNFEKEDILEDKEAMLNIRGFDTYQIKLGNKLLIHGHTPKPLEYILNQDGNCINIDGGCVYVKEKEEMGYLVAFDYDQKHYFYERCIDELV